MVNYRNSVNCYMIGVGFLDDAFVLAYVTKQLSSEIEKYKMFKGLA